MEMMAERFLMIIYLGCEIYSVERWGGTMGTNAGMYIEERLGVKYAGL